MKKNFLFIIGLFSILAFFSCKKDDDKTPEVAYEILEEQDFSAEEYADFLFGPESLEKASSERDQFFADHNALEQKIAEKVGDNGIAVQYKYVRFSYPSTDARNNTIRLSGTLALAYYWAFGDHYLDPDNIVLDCHWTKGKDAEVCDINYWKEHQSTGAWLMGAFDAIPSLSFAARDMLVIVPDYLGYGKTISYVHPYLNERLIAKNNYDAVVAAIQYIKDKYDASLESDVDMAIIGYSQGGAVAMASAMYFAEKNDANVKKWNLKRVCCGSGPYNPVKTMQTYYENDDNYYPAALPMVLMSMFYSYPEIMERNGHTMDDYFCEALKGSDLMTRIVSKGYTVDESNEYMAQLVTGSKKLPIKCSQFLSKEALDPESDIYKNLMECLEKNNLTNKTYWPKLPDVEYKFYYTFNDKVVPPTNTTEMMTRLIESGRSYTEEKEENENHSDYGSSFYKDLMFTKISNWCKE